MALKNVTLAGSVIDTWSTVAIRNCAYPKQSLTPTGEGQLLLHEHVTSCVPVLPYILSSPEVVPSQKGRACDNREPSDTTLLDGLGNHRHPKTQREMHFWVNKDPTAKLLPLPQGLTHLN